jgi:hypothetical protein
LEYVDVFWEINGTNAVEDADYAMTRNLAEPLICVEHPSVMTAFHPDDLFILPVDGWHRIWKAHSLRVPLTTYLLPRALEMQARVKEVIYV